MPSFFSYDAPTPPPGYDEHEDRQPPVWMQPPRDEVPAVLPAPRILARTDRVALWTSVVEVFSVGVRIPVAFVVRRGDESFAEWQELMGWHRPSAAVDGLRLGLELADGTRLGTEVEHFAPYTEVEPEHPTLVVQGGGGSGSSRRWELAHHLWLWPLPPAGGLDLVVEWRRFGVPETHVTFDADPLRNAASAAQPLWAD